MNELRPALPAGLLVRLAAMIYDWLLLSALFFVLTLALLLLRGGTALPPNTPWYSALLVVVSFLFYGWFWTHGGQTLGLRAWRLRVQRADGRPIGWRDALGRFAAAALLIVPPVVGLLWVIVDRRRAAWHDLLSDTRIVRLDSRSD